MNKTYMMPSIEIAEIKVENHLAAGSPLDSNSDTPTTDLSDKGADSDDIGANGGGSFWDDDD